jgi:hypothetical protein
VPAVQSSTVTEMAVAPSAMSTSSCPKRRSTLPIRAAAFRSTGSMRSWDDMTGDAGLTSGLALRRPRVSMRPRSSPVRLVRNRAGDFQSSGRSSAVSCSQTAGPHPRAISIVRVVSNLALGHRVVESFRSSSTQSAPWRPSSSAAARPAGPPPDTITVFSREPLIALLPRTAWWTCSRHRAVRTSLEGADDAPHESAHPG